MRQYHVYIMASQSRTLYVGMTNDLRRRIHEHRNAPPDAFVAQYRVTSLVYFEMTVDVASAITREKQLKRWPRQRKVRLIEAHNPEWRDLGVDWFR